MNDAWDVNFVVAKGRSLRYEFHYVLIVHEWLWNTVLLCQRPSSAGTTLFKRRCNLRRENATRCIKVPHGTIFIASSK